MTKTLPTDYQTYIHKSRYARWDYEKGRRETWEETVDRYMTNVVGDKLACYADNPVLNYDNVRRAILDLEVMPSMRCMMTAGPALDRDNVAGFNCSYLPVERIRDFSDTMYILMCGTGVGFSAERQFINKLPEVPELLQGSTVIVVHDSKEGWAEAYRQFLEYMYEKGEIAHIDYDHLRPAGAVLKTFGGRSSGPEPLKQLFEFTKRVFLEAQGRKLNSIEVHDIMCKIGEVIVSGGVRRSALISLSNLSDQRMANAKSGQWWVDNVQRALANNSVCYTEKPDAEIFLEEWLSLVRSKSGERGIFNRQAAVKTCQAIGRDHDWAFGCNPCSEIILRPRQFCNLTEAVLREEDNEHDIVKKLKIATILGTIQSTLTYFPYLDDEWKVNTEEERLLGVSMTGIQDSLLVSINPERLAVLLNSYRVICRMTNRDFAKKLGIERSAAITCVKPSGTVSQLVNSSEGCHARYADYYIRTVRGANTDPTTRFLIDSGVPHEPDVTKPDTTTVFSFPMKAPETSTKRNDRTAIQQLEEWMLLNDAYCDHKPSVTIFVRDHEWMEVGAFVYNNFDDISGISFLPHSDHTYQQAPYQEIDEEAYEELLAKMPTIDWDRLNDYETEDFTEGVKTLACAGGVCEI